MWARGARDATHDDGVGLASASAEVDAGPRQHVRTTRVRGRGGRRRGRGGGRRRGRGRWEDAAGADGEKDEDEEELHSSDPRTCACNGERNTEEAHRTFPRTCQARAASPESLSFFVLVFFVFFLSFFPRIFEALCNTPLPSLIPSPNESTAQLPTLNNNGVCASSCEGQEIGTRGRRCLAQHGRRCRAFRRRGSAVL